MNAARMALRRTSEPRVCLDKVIETMYETGKDMNAKYRETSRGGGNEDRCLRLISGGLVLRGLFPFSQPAIACSGIECYPYRLIFKGLSWLFICLLSMH